MQYLHAYDLGGDDDVVMPGVYAMALPAPPQAPAHGEALGSRGSRNEVRVWHVCGHVFRACRVGVLCMHVRELRWHISLRRVRHWVRSRDTISCRLSLDIWSVVELFLALP